MLLTHREEYIKRAMALPIVEQRRLLHLIEFIGKGHSLNDSLLAGFPIESKQLLLEMFQDRMKEDKEKERDQKPPKVSKSL